MCTSCEYQIVRTKACLISAHVVQSHMRALSTSTTPCLYPMMVPQDVFRSCVETARCERARYNHAPHLNTHGSRISAMMSCLCNLKQAAACCQPLMTMAWQGSACGMMHVKMPPPGNTSRSSVSFIGSCDHKTGWLSKFIVARMISCSNTCPRSGQSSACAISCLVS